MNDVKLGFDLNETEIFVNEVADDVLEAAACSGPEHARAMTIAMCTGQAECPY